MKYVFSVVLGMGLFIVSAANASSQVAETQNQFWTEVESLVHQCSVAHYDYSASGQKFLKGILSTCNDVKVTARRVKFSLHHHRYTAVITDSEFSDGGDLNHVTVYNSRGRIVAQRVNVLAFGDSLAALLGGRVGDLPTE